MNIADTLWGFVRRWYVVVPGFILAVAVGIGMFAVVQPGYERTATQLLIPGEGTIPPDTTNPYLFLGGLLQASDIVVRVMQSAEVLGPAVEDHPGTEVVVRRDPTVSGPVIQIVVTGQSDEAAEEVLSNLIDETSVVVERLQEQQNVDLDDRMSVSLLTEDTESVLQQKTRLLLSAGAALGLVVLTLIVASFVDGLARRARRGGRKGGSGRVDGAAVEDASDEAPADRNTDADDEVSVNGAPAETPGRDVGVEHDIVRVRGRGAVHPDDDAVDDLEDDYDESVEDFEDDYDADSEVAVTGPRRAASVR
ncbi:hypothetical protein [Microbacterium sp. Bi121]|uniref:hypothetical protein n=1 Tax=Microbacterium sp. Bi121 TaxID=2822348 RepID=UPI001D44310F|nr:hypothetical protein [Microbacterium sp. Bi121]CAH0122842.1 hypothetical protein SRABI121_00011 [Microbacterium sp. Bi121]